MNNVISLHHETRIVNDMAVWRNVKCLSDDDLFDEYHAVREEMRRRKRTDNINIH